MCLGFLREHTFYQCSGSQGAGVGGVASMAGDCKGAREKEPETNYIYDVKRNILQAKSEWLYKHTSINKSAHSS